MFEYFRLKEKIANLTLSVDLLKKENTTLHVQNQVLKKEIGQYQKEESARNSAQALHRQEMLNKLEEMFQNVPNSTILDAIRFYTNGPYNPYQGMAQYQPIPRSFGGGI